MDFKTLMNIASAKQESKDKVKINRYSLDLPPPQKEVKKEVARSDVVKRLIQEKENEKQMKENVKKEKEKAREREETKKAQFRIPKKPKEESKAIDTEKLISSLFDEEDDDPVANGHDTSLARLSLANSESKLEKESSNQSIKSSDSKGDKKHSSSSSSSRSKDKSSSSREKEKSSKEKHKRSHESSESSHSKSSSSKHGTKSTSSSEPHSSSSSNHKSSSSSSSNHKSSSSSSSNHKSSSSLSSNHKSSSSSSSNHKSSSSSSSNHKSSSSSSSNHKSSSSSSSNHKPSSSSSNHKSSSSSSQKASPSSSSSSKPSDSQQAKLSSEQPVTLSKHHLKPVAERQVDSSQLTERQRILARLQAIKERTLAAINKEQEGKRKRTRTETTHRHSKAGDKDDDRFKSKEIIRDNYSSDEGGEDNNMPSVIDIMLNEHQSKLERDKITRLAKQAWERATNKGGSTSAVKKDRKVRKRLSHSSLKSAKDASNHRKRKDHSLSPEPDRKKSKLSEEQRKRPKIVRHSGNAAPPPNFQAMMAMAQRKVQEPLKALPTIPKKKKKEEEERPMTQEEKERKQRVQSKEYKHWLKFGGKRPGQGRGSSSDSDEADKKDANRKEKDTSSVPHRKESNGLSALKSAPSNSNSKHHTDRDVKKSGPSVPSSKSKQITVNENVLVCGPAEDDGSDDGRSSQPENPFDRLYKSVHKKRPEKPVSAAKKRQLDDEFLDDEESESDLDEFIDDGDDGADDYSKHIAKIFGYNKNRYVDEDDDVSDMEANYATVMMEEKRSAKLGMMEDLEDMRMEQEELKRKAMMKKKMKR